MKRIVIIGGGPGGYVAAFAAAKAGADVCIVEAEAMGGTCLNRGCIPTKTLKSSAEALEKAHRLAEFGIAGVSGATVDMAAVLARKDRVRSILCTGLEKACVANKVRLVIGKGELLTGKKVRVHKADGEEELTADAIIIATGSANLALPTISVDHTHIITSDDALTLEKVPSRLLIVGGGVIGCEMAFIYRSFGAEVTIIEGQDRLLPLPAVDAEISRLLQREAKKRGIRFELAATVRSATVQANGTVACATGPSPFVSASTAQEKTLEADMVLVTVGRVPMTQGLGLEAAGVQTDARGWITVDGSMRTSAEDIYAIGDILGPLKVMLAHVASAEGLCAVSNILGKENVLDYSVIPSAIFTSPEIGCVGYSEEEAIRQGIEFETSVFQFRELGKAQAMGELAGLFKLICSKGTGKVIGGHIAGAHATDLIAEVALAIKLGATAKDVAETIHAHPTLAEGVYEAAMKLVE